MQNFTLSVFEAELSLKENAFLPPFKGSMFRGGLAWGVRKAACKENKKNCLECARVGGCAYSFLFESGYKDETDIKEIPRPYIIQIADDGRRNYMAGEALRFRITLFGNAVKMFAFILLGLEHFGSLGLGANRSRFSLGQVAAVDLRTGEKHPIYLPPNGYLDNAVVLSGTDLLGGIYSSPLGVNCNRLEIEFLTPTRLAEKGSLITRPSLNSIARAALRRLSSLSYYYCDEELDADFKSLVLAAENAELINEELQWVELKRFSSRRKKHLYISGFLGKTEYSGDLKELLPYLYLASLCHIGKGTVYGLGAYKLKLVL